MSWWNKLTPMGEMQCVNYALPYLMAGKLLKEGKANTDHLVTIIAHLRIATYLGSDPELIDNAKRITHRIVKEFNTTSAYTPTEADVIYAALLAYDLDIQNKPVAIIQKAIIETKKSQGVMYGN